MTGVMLRLMAGSLLEDRRNSRRPDSSLSAHHSCGTAWVLTTFSLLEPGSDPRCLERPAMAAGHEANVSPAYRRLQHRAARGPGSLPQDLCLSEHAA
jgi:hypothetical protein